MIIVDGVNGISRNATLLLLIFSFAFNLRNSRDFYHSSEDKKRSHVISSIRGFLKKIKESSISVDNSRKERKINDKMLL